jgi:hypothetical protein
VVGINIVTKMNLSESVDQRANLDEIKFQGHR